MGGGENEGAEKQPPEQKQVSATPLPASSASPKDLVGHDDHEEESRRQTLIHHHILRSHGTIATTSIAPSPPMSSTLISAAPSPLFDHPPISQSIQPQRLEGSWSLKRPRFNPNPTGQWKLVTTPPVPPHSSSSSSQHKQSQSHIPMSTAPDSIPSPTNVTNPQGPQPHFPAAATNTITATAAAAAAAATPTPHHTAPASASSSDATTSSPSPSPLSIEPTKLAESEQHQQTTPIPHQLRKGKFVSPVWKPHEMLWLARAWKVQYQVGSDGSGTSPVGGEIGGGATTALSSSSSGGGGGGRGKTRAEKDRQVAEFLNRHGVNRDAKTAGTKWDNMLGEFRKVFEWERGGEREQLVGKSYFRLSPYERKLHRLPASFDEEVFEELSKFMGSRSIRATSSQSRGGLVGAGVAGGSGNYIINVGGGSGSGHELTSAGSGGCGTRLGLLGVKPLRSPPQPPHPPLGGAAASSTTFRDEDHPLTGRNTGQMVLATTSTLDPTNFHNLIRSSNLLNFEESLASEFGAPSTSKEIRRIGRIRMIWEESATLWAEEGELHHRRGRVKVLGSSFLNADELTYFDDSMVACTMEAFEDGPLKGLSVDRFIPGQHVKVFGRRKSYSSSVPGPSAAAICSWEDQDPTENYMSLLRLPPSTLPSLFELSWYIQERPPEDLRLHIRRDIYKDLPHGKELFFTPASLSPSTDYSDCKSFTIDILSSLLRSTATISSSSRDSFIPLWDDCINRLVSKFCPLDITFIRKPTIQPWPSSSEEEDIRDQWPNLTGFVKNFCLWRGEETDRIREGNRLLDPSSTIVEKIHWTYTDVIPYILGYYAIGHTVTFCALSRSLDRVVRTDLYSLDLSLPADRIKILVPCWRIGGLLALLAERCLDASSSAKTTGSIRRSSGSVSSGYNKWPQVPYGDFQRIDMGNGHIVEMTPNTVIKYYPTKRRWSAVKEIYGVLVQGNIPHTEYAVSSSESDLSTVFKPRGYRATPMNVEQLVEALKHVTKALVALHDLCFMHRDLSWEKVLRRCDKDEWFVSGFEEAVAAPQISGGGGGLVGIKVGTVGVGGHAPEMMVGRGVHGVKVDVWGLGQLVKACGLTAVLPKQLRELQNRCLEQNPEMRPTAADCYHHLLQFQSSLSAAAAQGNY